MSAATTSGASDGPALYTSYPGTPHDSRIELLRRPQLIDEFLPKLEEWMEASNGKIRAGVAHDKLVAMNDGASERTTWRAEAQVRAACPAGHRRVHRRS